MKKKYCLAGVLALLLTVAAECRAQAAHYCRLERETIENRLRQYGGEDAERGATLARLFENAGCVGDRLRLQPVLNADAANVLCTLEGSSGKVIVVGAHFDRVDAGDGVADNWSGASLLPSLYQSLSAEKRRHTFIFIGFSDEEEGFIGSRFYVDQLTEEEMDSIRVMINLDTLGLDSTLVWTAKSDPGMVALLDRVAGTLGLPLHTMDVDDIGDSDGSSFRKRGIPTVTLHSVTRENLHILHSEDDKYSALDIDDYYDTYNLIAAYLAVLDQREPRLAPPENRAVEDEKTE
ncbi:MAG: M28 family peptidase [Acidobacteria bacterium]|nr:M28 family peptidase [Acidobacteriota bacterium]